MTLVVVYNGCGESQSGTNRPIRPWRGIGPEQRVADRRSRLMEAGLEVFCAAGFQQAKVRDVCREAGLTQRYFYESFTTKEALLAAITDEVVTDLIVAARPGIELGATDVEVAIDTIAHAVVASLTDDPRRARILFVEAVGVSRELEDRRRILIGSLADVVRAAADLAFGPRASQSRDVELIARGLIGAAQELLIAYVRGEIELTRSELIQHFARILLQAGPLVEALADVSSVIASEKEGGTP